MAVSPVEAVPARGVERVIDVLTAAFDGYEAMTYMLGPEGTPEDLRALVSYFVRSRSSVGSPIFGVRDSDSHLIGAAITDPPHPPVRSDTSLKSPSAHNTRTTHHTTHRHTTPTRSRHHQVRL